MVTINQPIMLLLTVIQISNKNLKFQLNRVVYLCLRNIWTKFQVNPSFLFWVMLNNLTSICSIWQRPWNHSTNIFIRIFLLHRIHCVLTHEVEMKVESQKSDIEFHTLVCNWIQTLLSYKPEIVFNYCKRIIWAYSFVGKKMMGFSSF